MWLHHYRPMAVEEPHELRGGLWRVVMASHTKSLNVLGSNTQEVPCVHYTPSFKSGMKVGETLSTPNPFPQGNVPGFGWACEEVPCWSDPIYPDSSDTNYTDTRWCMSTFLTVFINFIDRNMAYCSFYDCFGDKCLLNGKYYYQKYVLEATESWWLIIIGFCLF